MANYVVFDINQPKSSYKCRGRLHLCLQSIHWKSCLYGILFGSVLSVLFTISTFLIIFPYLTNTDAHTMLGNITVVCDEDWIWNANFAACYYFSTNKSSWHDAQETCRQHAGNLVTIHLESEDLWLAKESSLQLETSPWIGGKREGNSYKWILPNGNIEMNYTRWAPGEPKPPYFGNNNFVCVNLWKEVQYKWDNYDCSHKMNFICKRYL